VREHGPVTASLQYAARQAQVCAIWHARVDADPAQAWLRALLAQLALFS